LAGCGASTVTFGATATTTPAALTVNPAGSVASTSTSAPSGAPGTTTGVTASAGTLPEDSTTTAPSHTSPPVTAAPSLQPARGLRVQDPALTPGVIDPRVTQANIHSTICVRGYTKTVRHVTTAMKTRVYHSYGIMSHAPGSYEVDHLISLELGGSNDIGNLWPEPYFGTNNAHDKDYWENELHRQVCNGSITLAAAQNAIVHWWVLLGATSAGTSTGTVGGSTGGGAATPTTSPKPAVTTTTASSGGGSASGYVTPGAFCSPIGATGVSAAGNHYLCATTKADGTPYAGGRAHWRRG
jgi:hypothetical protein